MGKNLILIKKVGYNMKNKYNVLLEIKEHILSDNIDKLADKINSNEFMDAMLFDEDNYSPSEINSLREYIHKKLLEDNNSINNYDLLKQFIGINNISKIVSNNYIMMVFASKEALGKLISDVGPEMMFCYAECKQKNGLTDNYLTYFLSTNKTGHLLEIYKNIQNNDSSFIKDKIFKSLVSNITANINSVPLDTLNYIINEDPSILLKRYNSNGNTFYLLVKRFYLANNDNKEDMQNFIKENIVSKPIWEELSSKAGLFSNLLTLFQMKVSDLSLIFEFDKDILNTLGKRSNTNIIADYLHNLSTINSKNSPSFKEFSSFFEDEVLFNNIDVLNNYLREKLDPDNRKPLSRKAFNQVYNTASPKIKDLDTKALFDEQYVKSLFATLIEKSILNDDISGEKNKISKYIFDKNTDNKFIEKYLDEQSKSSCYGEIKGFIAQEMSAYEKEIINKSINSMSSNIIHKRL